MNAQHQPPDLPALPARFRVLQELHRDPLQIRLRAVDTTLEREVVVELPGAAHPGGVDPREQQHRVLREARMLAKVHHPGVQGILEVIEHDGRPLLVLQPLPGRTLAEILAERGALPPDEVRRIGQQVAEAVQALHAVGVVHRDLREANVAIGPDGACMVTGFGFAKPLGTPAQMSSLDHKGGEGERTRRGLPTYPAPEQFTGIAADARADVWALGCVLLRCLGGQPPDPEQGGTPAGVLAAGKAHGHVVPKALGQAIAGCLTVSPMARFRTMLAVAEALAPAAAPSGASSGGRRRPALLALAALAVAAPLVLWAWLGGRGGDPPDRSGEQAIVTRGRNPDAPPAPASPADRQRLWFQTGRALLIGLDYEGRPFSRLNNAMADTEAVAEALRELGWTDVTTVLGPEATGQRIEAELGRLDVRAQEQDQVLVYFAGHGIRHPSSERVGWILPHDAEARPADRPSGDRWLPFTTLTNVLGTLKARHVLFALDCCHAGAATRAGDVVRAESITRMLEDRVRVLLTSCTADQVAHDGDGRHSPFANAFLDVLAAARAGTDKTGVDLLMALRQRLPPNQRPVYYPQSDHRAGADFVFGRYGR